MTKLGDLKIKREGIVARLTRFKQFIDEINQNHQHSELNERIKRCEELFDSFDSIQSSIEVLSPQEDNVSEREGFEDTYFAIISQAKQLLANLNQSASTSTAANIINSNVNSSSMAKLPSMDLPNFAGAYEDWVTFYDTFKTLIHCNKNLSNTEKLYYLRSCLKGYALEVIRNIKTSEDSYGIALAILKERFDNKRLIVNSHIKALFDLSAVTKESEKQLRKLHDDIITNVRSLEILGQPVDSWNTLLIYMFTKKLDPISKREWEQVNVSNSWPSLQEFFDFLIQRCQLLEKLHIDQDQDLKHNKSSISSQESNKIRFKKYATNTRSLATVSKSFSCYYCKEAHTLYRCKKFLDLPTKSQINEIERMKLCVNCLRANHIVDKCMAPGCRYCNQRHNSILHTEQQSKNIDQRTGTSNNAKEESTLAMHCTDNRAEILLSTALVDVVDSNGQSHTCRVLLDPGSQSNFITTSLSKRLNLKKQNTSVSIGGINQSSTRAKGLVQATVRSRMNNFKFDGDFLILDNITNTLPSTRVDTKKLTIPKNIWLADNNFDTPSGIDLLLGVTCYYKLICVGQITIKESDIDIVLQKTCLGWIISGKIPRLEHFNQSDSEISCNLSTTLVQEQLEKFWVVESCDDNNSELTKEEQYCETHYQNTTIRTNTGRLQVKLPTKENISELEDNYSIAERRLISLERRLSKNEHLKEQYHEFMKEYEQLNHMTMVNETEDDVSRITYYIPHHGVYKEDSVTTKLRVVFDASCKSETGISLNDTLMIGKNLQEDLFSVLLRFRKPTYALTGDITKMYRQILVSEEQRDLQRILWRPSADQPIRKYCLNTVTYGTACASFLAIRSLQQVAKENEAEFPTLAKVILKNFYVDDLLCGADTIEQTRALRKELMQLLINYGFELRKWSSNCREILNDDYESKSDHTIKYFINEDNITKTLGVTWNSKRDTLQYYVHQDEKPHRVTKRIILSRMSRLFDPIGLASPIIIKAKILMQRIWQLGIDWDEALPFDIHSSWLRYDHELQHVTELETPRRVFCQNPTSIQLHCYSDASEKAYGACIFVRSTNDRGEHFVRLLCAKSRVAPLKIITLPRLELCGALLLCQLVKKVISALEIEFNAIYYYTDSTIVLSWINSDPGTLKTFVANRVAEIQRLSTSSSWSHIDSENNPADVISRGTTAEQLNKMKLWWCGPNWLTKDQDSWPLSQYQFDQEIPEKRSIKAFHVVVNSDIVERYSTLSKLQRVIAYCLRFSSNSRCRPEKRILGILTVDELNESLRVIIRLAQSQVFFLDISALKDSKPLHKSSNLLSLNPFLDNKGILRVGGRLNKASIPYDEQHQIILPKNHHVTRLIISNEHQRLLHAGPQAILAALKLRYWPLGGRNTIKSVLYKCVVCTRARPKPYEHIMGNLPTARVTPERAFNNVGLDFAGPFDLKITKFRNRKFTKAYLCIFVCFSTKAVHMDVVCDLTTDSFLNCLKRFMSRRGKCSNIYSDNATNFVGAKNELEAMVHFLQNEVSQETIQNFLAKDNIRWHTIPPRAPHFGGLWESAVKSAKYHLKRVVGQTHLTLDEFYTVVTQIEACLNSRPLTPLTQDPSDLSVLTPAHFLIGESLAGLPEHDLVAEPTNRLNKYQLLTNMCQHFWRRWHKEYLHTLQQRRKWTKPGKNEPHIGDMVLVMEDHLPPLQWVLGRIIEVVRGDDGVVRVARVRTKTRVIDRAVKRLCPLPIECS